MAFWTTPYRFETAVNRDSGFCWQQVDGVPAEDASSNDLFGQFVDFDGEAENIHDGSSTIAYLPDALFMDHDMAAQGTAPSAISSAVSSADEFDFPSNSSHVGPGLVAAPASHDLDTQDLFLGEGGGEPSLDPFHEPDCIGRGAVSDTELQRLEEISLGSPQQHAQPASYPPSPSPPNTITRGKKHPRKFVEALSSTIRKATTIRRHKKPVPAERAPSPTLIHPPMAIKHQTRTDGMASIAQSSLSGVAPESPAPSPFDSNAAASFTNAIYDDPFADLSPTNPGPNMRYYSQSVVDVTALRPPARRINSDQQLYATASDMMATTGVGTDAAIQAPASVSWQQSIGGQGQWTGSEFEADESWFNVEMFADNKNVNQAMHLQQAELPYEYTDMPGTSAAGLMIQMPRSRPPQPQPQPQPMAAPGMAPGMVLNTQTYLPPHRPPHRPPHHPPPPLLIPNTERTSRPPRAPSSGARHRNLSSSPMRKTRRPSAPPVPAQPSQARNMSRHSSTGSMSSVRSAPGRATGSAPNTPSGVRKRRSREVSGSSGSGGGDDIGFVNYTPDDANILMMGVAPSGSSKTKARREKEAEERRRKLSAAAMKAVAAAGGDVDKLLKEGFEF